MTLMMDILKIFEDIINSNVLKNKVFPYSKVSSLKFYEKDKDICVEITFYDYILQINNTLTFKLEILEGINPDEEFENFYNQNKAIIDSVRLEHLLKRGVGEN